LGAHRLNPALRLLAACVAAAGCSTATPAPRASAPLAGARNPLSGLGDALADLGHGVSKTPVQIVQIGDSHTANDGFSGRMRELFQARFGDGGRGMLPPGIPFRLYKPAQVEVTAYGWKTIGSLREANPGPFGIAGVRQHADGAAVMTLRSTTPAGLGNVEIEVWGQPGGGSLEAVWDGGSPASFSTNATTAGPLFLSLPPGPKGAGLTLRARGNGPVDVLSWTSVQAGPGVAYSNLGTIGATIGTVGRWDPALVRAELARLHPALMLIAFGTNEGFADSTDMASYPALYAARVEELHAAAPQAAIAIIGPPDGTRAAKAQDRASTCPPVEAGHTAWEIPPHLAPVREAERAFALAHGYFYWDWSAAMGGPCSITRWALTVPPMAAADHVHLLRPGYRATGELLFDALMRSMKDTNPP
jgi:lysophospholipase L1-like esterase